MGQAINTNPELDTIITITFKDVENVLRNRFDLIKEMENRIRELDRLCDSDIAIRDLIEAATYKSLAFDEKNVASAPTNALNDLYVIVEKYNRRKESYVSDISRVILYTVRELEKTHRIYSCYLALSRPEERKVLKYTYEEPVDVKVNDCFKWLADDLHCSVSNIKIIRRRALDNILKMYYSYFSDNELLERSRLFMQSEKKQ